MPNFKLGSGIKDDIRVNAARLAQRRVDHMTAQFPLTMAQVQAAIMPPEALKQIRWLKSQNVVGIGATNRIFLRFAPDAMPGLDRYAVAQLYSPEGIYPAKHSSFYGSHHEYVERDHRNDLTLHEGELDDESRDAVTAWALKSIKERRLQLLSNQTVNVMLDRCTSSGDVLARWPFLATLVPEQGDATLKVWRNRFRNGPRDLRRYAWSPDNLLRRMMDATEVFLGSAMMLEDYKHTEGTIRAEMVAWSK